MARTPDWTDAATQRLWNYYGSLPDEAVPYFARQVGDGLLNFAKFYGILKGEILDYGCGPGHLTEKLIRRGLAVTALDFSKHSCEKTSERIGLSDNLRKVLQINGLPAPLPDGSFDLVVCSEVVEHLPDAWLDPTINELYRLTRPGGYVLISTPNAENLRDGFVYCPFCDSEFHRWQHQRTWAADTLRSTVERAGFCLQFVQGIDLFRFQTLPAVLPLRRLSAARLADCLLYSMARLSERLGVAGRTFRYLNGPGPSLVCVARKPTGGSSS